MRGAGAHHGKRAHPTAGVGALAVELRLDQVGRPEIRGVGVGHVFGEYALALLVPLHLGAQRRQDWKVVDGHRKWLPVNLWQTPRGRQNLPGAWLTAG